MGRLSWAPGSLALVPALYLATSDTVQLGFVEHPTLTMTIFTLSLSLLLLSGMSRSEDLKTTVDLILDYGVLVVMDEMKPDEMTTHTVWEKLKPIVEGVIKDGTLHSDVEKISTIWHGIGDAVVPLFQTGDLEKSKVEAVVEEAYEKLNLIQINKFTFLCATIIYT